MYSYFYRNYEVVIGQKNKKPPIKSNRLESFLLNKQYPTPPKCPLTVFETKGTHNCCLKSMEVYTPKYLFTYFKKFKQKLKLFGQPVLSAFWKLNTGEQIFTIYLLHWKKLRYLDSLRYVCRDKEDLHKSIYSCWISIFVVWLNYSKRFLLT